MDLPLAYDVGLEFCYSDASNVYVLSWISWQRRKAIAVKASNTYKHCKSRLRTVIRVVFGHLAVILNNDKWPADIGESNPGP